MNCYITIIFFIEIAGFLRNIFVIKNKSNPNELFAAITDGKYKIDIIFNKTENDVITFEKGVKIELIGYLQELGKFFFLYYLQRAYIKKLLIFSEFYI